MSSEAAVQFNDVWKKYSMRGKFHRSLREDIINILKRPDNGSIKDDEFWALKKISFAVRKGDCVGIYGPNASGKSTILKLIASVTYSNIGEVVTKGKIAPLIELGAGFHPDLTGRENVYMNGTIIGMSIKEINRRLDDIVRFSELGEFIEMPVKKYSSGMYLRLAFSVAIHSEADIFLIDEILAVGDEGFQTKCLEKIQELKKKKQKTLIFVTHDRVLMDRVADRIIYINKGELTAGNESVPNRP